MPEYEPYGIVWQKELMKWKKVSLVDWIKELLIEKRNASKKLEADKQPTTNTDMDKIAD